MQKNNTAVSRLFHEPLYLTDGGLETTLIFHEGIELVHFAAFELLRHPQGRRILVQYYTPYLRLAHTYGLPFVLETPTWRASADWGYKLGYSSRELHQINRDAVAFIRGLKLHLLEDGPGFLLSGNLGPRGDGYQAQAMQSPAAARAYHLPQIRAFAEEGVDLITAMTITYSHEALGIVQAAESLNLPVVVSFTVETDGRLPSGESLQAAIEKIDWATDNYATHFMINCAHPEHFMHILQEPGAWKNRIGGIRANASMKSHAELDACEVLDTGDPYRLTRGYLELKRLLPALKVVGGCCGTDHSHLEQLCSALVFSPNRTPNAASPGASSWN